MLILSVLVCKIVPIPFQHVGLFSPSLMVLPPPHFYFDTILPQIQADSRNQMCLPLTRYFQVAITHCQPADISSDYLNVYAPSPVAHNPCLLGYSHELIFHHFPKANPTAVNMQHSQIAVGLSVLYQQKEEHYQEAKIAKEVEKQASVSK